MVNIRGKPFSFLKVFFATILISLLCIITYKNAYAEYYIGGMGNCCGYFAPPPPCYIEIHSHSPHRYNDFGSGQVEEYEWVGDP
jgi:hypothetical protein